MAEEVSVFSLSFVVRLQYYPCLEKSRKYGIFCLSRCDFSPVSVRVEITTRIHTTDRGYAQARPRPAAPYRP
jgi:hypothetical protein